MIIRGLFATVLLFGYSVVALAADTMAPATVATLNGAKSAKYYGDAFSLGAALGTSSKGAVDELEVKTPSFYSYGVENGTIRNYLSLFATYGGLTNDNVVAPGQTRLTSRQTQLMSLGLNWQQEVVSNALSTYFKVGAVYAVPGHDLTQHASAWGTEFALGFEIPFGVGHGFGLERSLTNVAFVETGIVAGLPRAVKQPGQPDLLNHSPVLVGFRTYF